MSEHFIKNIEIKNFKCFDNFKAEGFGRVNLIGGKNNVGKTAFMEATYINVSAKELKHLVYAIVEIQRNRNRLNTLNSVTPTDLINSLLRNRNMEINSSINKLQYLIDDSSLNPSINISINGEKSLITSVNPYNFMHNTDIIFIDNYGFNDNTLKETYQTIQLQDNDNLLNNYLLDFDSNILQFKIIGDKPYVKTHSSNNYFELQEFGDGVKKYISIISSLFATTNNYLFIDEIENGIHYTNLDKLWEIILTISKEQNVQVFATTHSKECIESYARVAKQLEEKEKIEKEAITFIELGRNKEDKIKAIVMNRDRFFRDLEVGNEVRGW